jgi:hypothetical protein
MAVFVVPGLDPGIHGVGLMIDRQKPAFSSRRGYQGQALA